MGLQTSTAGSHRRQLKPTRPGWTPAVSTLLPKNGKPSTSRRDLAPSSADQDAQRPMYSRDTKGGWPSWPACFGGG